MKNAVEAMPAGGEITVTSRVKGDKAEIGLRRYRRGASRREGGENIFQPYFTTKEKGTGLGLAICQNIMPSTAAASLPTAPRAGEPPSPSNCPYRRPPRLMV